MYYIIATKSLLLLGFFFTFRDKIIFIFRIFSYLTKIAFIIIIDWLFLQHMINDTSNKKYSDLFQDLRMLA